MSYKFNPFTGNLDVTPFSLDGAGKIPSDYLPSYVDDVVEYDDLAGFPGTGETGKIYVAKDTGYTYRWTGSVYVRIGSGGEVELDLGSEGSPSLFFNGDANTGLYSPGADQLAISTNGTERLRITSAGLVGIGTSSPAGPLHVSSSIAASTSITNANSQLIIQSGAGSGTNNRSTIYLQPLNSSGNGSPAAISALASGNTNSDLAFYTNPSSNYSGTPTERLRIDSSGNVGIGTTVPDSLLDCAGGNITLTEDTNVLWKNSARNTNRGAIQFDSSGNFRVRYGFALTEGYRLDSSGRLLVGTSSSTQNIQDDDKQAIVLQGNANNGGLSVTTYNGTSFSDSTGPRLNFQRSRGTTDGTMTVVTPGDLLGEVEFRGADGTNFISAATINAFSDGTPGSNDMPGRLVFSTTADGASSPTERLRIDSSGRVGIGTSAPIKLLHLSTSSDNEGIVLQKSSIGGSAGARISFQQNNTASTSTEIAAIKSDQVNATAGTEAGGLTLYTKAGTDGSAQARLRITETGAVGIGTTSPGSELELSSATNTGITIRSGTVTDYGFINFTDGATKGQILYDHDGDYMRFYTNGAEAARIDSSGKVGIGTSSPPRALTNAAGTTLTTGTAPQYRLNGTATDGSDADRAIFGLATSSGQFVDSAVAGDAVLRTTDGGNLLFGEGTTERMRIDSSGRLLVGTSSTSADCNSVFVGSSTSANSVIHLGRSSAVSNGSSLGVVAFGDSSQNVYAQIVANADATPGASDYPGRLVFSTTADGASSPTERMRIQNNGGTFLFQAGDGFRSHTSAGAGTTFILFSGLHTATSNTNGTQSFLVYSNGNVLNTNNSYGSLSDVKLKENIVDASSQWDDLKAIQVRNYNFKEGQTHTQIGLVAQEVELVSPGLVSESPDRDEDGNDLGTVTKSVNYSVLYMKAVKALQEAMERIETLEAKVAALEA